jgi:predicted Zn-dependent protease
MLDREQAAKLTAKILAWSQYPECSVSLSESEVAHVRFARGGITTSGLSLQNEINISSTREGRTGTVTVTETDDESLRAAVKRSEEYAAVAPVNQEHVDPVGPQKYPEMNTYDEATANARGAVFINQIRPILERARKDNLLAAGLFSRTTRRAAIANKGGNFGFARTADAHLTTTLRRTDGSSSGWAGQPSRRIAEINGAALAERAASKCLRWTNPVRLEPGNYEVVLEPTAASDLLGFAGFYAFSARAAEEGRSFFAKKGGGTLVGEKLFPELVTLRSDPFDPRYSALPWTREQLPDTRVTWIDKGVVKDLYYDRFWAKQSGHAPTPPPMNAILDGSSASLDDLVGATKRGLLVTRFWYIRPLNPRTAQFTGLTRDGLFLIEDGKVTQPVVNFRFNESPLRMLQNVLQVGAPVRCRGGEGFGIIAPPLRAKDFHFASVSDAV